MTGRVTKRRVAVGALGAVGLAVAAAEAYALIPELRGACVAPLAWAGADECLVALAAEGEPAVYGPATAAILRRGPAAVPALVRCAESAATPARGVAVALLARIGPAAAGAAPLLKGLACDADPQVRSAAVGALVAVAPADPDTLAVVARDIDSADPDVRAAAVEHLNCTEFPADRVTPLLARIVAADRACTRRAAAEGLGRLGAAGKTGVPALIAALDDPDEGMRVAARAALEAVVTGLADADAPLRDQGRAALARPPRPAPPDCPAPGCPVTTPGVGR